MVLKQFGLDDLAWLLAESAVFVNSGIPPRHNTIFITALTT